MTETISKRKDYLEKMIVGMGFVAIFLPLRYFFYVYVSEFWLGSVGIISLVIGIITYLSYKNKFGKFGRLWKKQIYRIARGKLGTIALILGVFFVIFFGTLIWAFEAGKESEAYQISIIILEEENLMLSMDPQEALEHFTEVGRRTDLETFNQASENLSALWAEDPALFIDALVVIAAVVNTWVGGWLGHLYVILFVQELETIFLIVFFRWVYPVQK